MYPLCVDWRSSGYRARHLSEQVTAGTVEGTWRDRLAKRGLRSLLFSSSPPTGYCA